MMKTGKETVISLRKGYPKLVEEMNLFLDKSRLKVSGGSKVITEDGEETFFIFLEKINGSQSSLSPTIGRKLKEKFNFPRLVLDGTIV